MRIAVAGQSVHAALEAERERVCLKSTRVPGCYESQSLCAWQSEVARRGVLGAELVQSVYGWTLRYDSGLQDFGIIASGGRSKELGWSYERALREAQEWQAHDHERRYVTAYK